MVASKRKICGFCDFCVRFIGQGVRGFRPSGRRSNDHWPPPLNKPKIRKIRKIRDLLNYSSAAPWSNRIFPNGWTNKDFLGFLVERFSRGLNECHEVVLGGLDSAAESLLSDDESEAGSRGAIGRLHSISSIFHLSSQF